MKKIVHILTIIMLMTSLMSFCVQAADIKINNGTYEVAVDLAGGTGKASITSPAKVTVTDGKALAMIEWSSPNYDYMIVNGEKYLPVNTEGNSVFEIPVAEWDKEISVIADTVAMSTPHEIEYTLVFHSDALGNKTSMQPIFMQIAVVVLAAVLAKVYLSNRKKKH